MKRLSDYKGEEAMELWADLLDPITKLIGDKELGKITSSGAPKMELAKYILKHHSEEATEILQRIDPTPVDGFNVLIRLLSVIMEIGQSEEAKSFFGYAEQVNEEEKSSGSPTVITEVEKN